MNIPLDPNSPVPLYHQIAQALRYQIATGRFERSSRLPPVREAAVLWGVNLHTVRRAYDELARDGLVEVRRQGGTRVLAPARRTGPAGSLGTFLDRIVRQARETHGLSPADLVRLLAGWSGPPAGGKPEVLFVECSETQALGHCREIEGAFEVTALPWTLARSEDPPEGTLVATYFHYNDIRRRWPERLPRIVFVTIRPDPSLAGRLPRSSFRSRGVRTLLVCERDQETARNVAADLSLLFPPDRFSLECHASRRPAELLRDDRREPVLFSPRVWAGLNPEARAHARAVEIRYAIVPSDLASLGEHLGWRARPVRAPA